MMFVLILLLAHCSHVSGTRMHFTDIRVECRVCDTMMFPQAIDNTLLVSVKSPPVTYSFSGNSSVFAIDHQTGIISTLIPLQKAGGSRFILQKEATDHHGNTARMEIHVSVVKSRRRIKQCPKLQLMSVRATAVLGEEVGQLECDGYVPGLFEKGRTTVNVTGEYLPFNITSAGIVVVTSPLHFRNSIGDIIIFNATVKHFSGNGSHGDCRVTQSQLVVRVTVKKTECPSNWTYLIQINKILWYPALISLSSVTAEQCMAACSAFNSTPCNSLAYDLIRRSCDLYNESDVTVPKLVQGRLGVFLYRKHCETDMLPKYVLRQLSNKINSMSLLNTSVSEQLLQAMLSVMAEVNMTHEDRLFTAGLVYSIVANTTFSNSTNHRTTKYLKAVCQLVDHFVDEQVAGIPKDMQDLHQLLLTFDTFMETMTSGLTPANGNLDVKSNHTHVRTHHVSRGSISQEVDLIASGDTSRVTFPVHFNGTKEHQPVLFVTGAITIPETLQAASKLTGVKDHSYESHMTLSGHMVSVNLRPYSRAMFGSPLQIDIFTSVTDVDLERVCVFLQIEIRSHHWASTGCQMVTYNSTHVRCLCNHLTSFAVLMQIKDFQLSKVHRASLEFLTVIGCCISIVALSTTVLILLWLRLHSDRYVLLMNLSVALVLAQVVFLTGIDATQPKVLCRLVAILLHYLYLAVFSLMLAEGIYLYQKLYRAFTADTSLTLFLLLGWGAPFIVVSISLLTDTEGYGTDTHCWLSTDGAIWAFVGPALTIVSINTAILVIILQTFLGIKINARKTDTEKFKASVRVTVVLLPLLGITWIFGVVAVNSSTVVFQYVFAVLNSLQGLFIFLFHIVFNDEVRSLCSRYRARVATLAYTVDPAPDNRQQVRGQRQTPDIHTQPRGQQELLYRKITPTLQN